VRAFGARAEAAERLEGRFDVRVLEPSPPAVPEAPFADDPVAGGDVVPLDRAGARSWASLCEGDADLSAWCGDRWLAGWHRLGVLPEGFAATRGALHAVAEHVVAPARFQANGKIGLRFTRGGFGSPFFSVSGGDADGSDGDGDGRPRDRQVRIDDGDLVVSSGSVLRRASVTTLAAAASMAGLVAPGAPLSVYTPTTAVGPDDALVVEPVAARALGEWYGFCASVLEQLRSESADSSLLQLWPEHFDLAVDLGDKAAARRANFGGSPGDAGHPEPYLYVGPWGPRSMDGYWNEAFGASLSYPELLEADDQRARALSFLRRGRDLLAGP
jgi:hypothetical protein